MLSTLILNLQPWGIPRSRKIPLGIWQVMTPWSYLDNLKVPICSNIPPQRIHRTFSTAFPVFLICISLVLFICYEAEDFWKYSKSWLSFRSISNKLMTKDSSAFCTENLSRKIIQNIFFKYHHHQQQHNCSSFTNHYLLWSN